MSDFVRRDEVEAIIERAKLDSLRLTLDTLADYLECTTTEARELVLISARAQLDAMQAATRAALDGLEGQVTFEERRAALVARIRRAGLAAEVASKGMPNSLPNPYMRGDDQIVIQFTPADAAALRKWQEEQRLVASQSSGTNTTARISLSPADREAFQKWRDEQLQKQREYEASQREPWESDPDAWKAGGE